MHFADPAWLMLLVLLPLLATTTLLVARLRRKQWHAFVAPRLRQILLRRSSPLPRWLAIIFLVAAAATLIVALARPQGDATTHTEKSIGRNVLVALDLSRSMRVKDVKPDRLAQAKVIIYELLDALPNERIGLLGFAGSAHLFAPLTIDHAAVRETVEQVDENWVSIGGSNLSSAIRLAITTLKETGQKNNALIILSDGEKHEGSLGPVVAEAKKSGVYIFAIGVGTEDGGYVPNPDSSNTNMVDRKGKIVLSRLQPEVLRKLASDTNGRYAMAGGGTDIATMVSLAAKDLDAFEMRGRERRVAIEFYQWLVLPAILFLIVAVIAGTRWRGLKPASLLALALAASPSGARADDATAAAQALAAGANQPARNAFHQLAEASRVPEYAARYRLGEGTAAYRAKDFTGACEAFSAALLARDSSVLASAHFGIANSLFQLGWLNLTGSTYPNSTNNLPDLASFDALVKARLGQIRKTEATEDTDTPGVPALESLIINWSDSIQHDDSALAHDPGNQDLRHNRQTTLTYLKRLRELMEKEREQTNQAIPQPQPGPDPGNPGDSGEDDPPKPGEQGQPGDKAPPKDPGTQGDKGQQPKG
ncbi:MAG: VWA domain-containing protein, partial [Verrucomicrobiota bacterium]